MIATDETVVVTCPQCFRRVQITADRYLDEDGDLYVDAEPVWRAMGIHMRVGCVRRGST